MKVLFIVVIALTSTLANSQNQYNSKDNEDKSAYFKWVYKDCPNADILELEQKEDYLEIEYLCNGKFVEMALSNGHFLFKESEAELSDDAIENIKDKLAKKYEGWMLDEISEITTPDTTFYKIEVIKKGVEQNLFVTTDGKWYKYSSNSDNDPWNVEALEKAGVFENSAYDLLNPEATYALPDILKEVSGITLDRKGNLYCVQDELGVVFEYDLKKSVITKQYRFTDVGDFEDIAIKNDSIFVLRSDGNIFGFKFPNKGAITQNMVSLDALDYESLTYSSETGLFYITSKDAGITSGDSKRVIYSFTTSQAQNPKSVLTINIDDLNKNLKEKHGELAKEKFKFSPSAIAIHPKTKEYYILSAHDNMLVVYNSKGLKASYPLPAELYYKPEGLAFAQDGTLYISSEGEKRGLISGTIYKFSPR